MVDVVAVVELTIGNCCTYLVRSTVDVFGLSCIVDFVGSRLSMRAVLPNVFHCGISFIMCSCWPEITS
jgi:hypothetical protein